MSFLLTGHALGNIQKHNQSCQHTDTVFRCLEYIKNHDGDTATFNIPNVHPLIGKGISVRIKGIDTPEIGAKGLCEKQKAQEAKTLVANILGRAKKIELHHVERGKYFRIIADVIVDGKSIKNKLIRSKLAHPYDGDKKRQVGWCL